MSSALCEEGHAAGATLMRDHERYTEKALRVRALLYSLRPLVRKLRAPLHVRMLETRMTKIQKRQPLKAAGRQLFFKKTVKDANVKQYMDSHQRRDVTRQCMAMHGREFKQLCTAEQHALRQQARTEAVSKDRDNEAERRRLNAEHGRLNFEAGEAVRRGAKPNHMVQARVDDQWLEHAVDHYNNESEGLTLESHIRGFRGDPS